MSYIDFISSAIGTAIAEIITLPIYTVKTRYQTNLDHKSIIHTYKEIMNTYGIKGFYNSVGYALFSQMVSISTKFAFYSYIKQNRGTQQQDLKNNVLNGAASGVLSSLFVHPIDVPKILKQNGMSFKEGFKKDGFSIFYRGYTKTLAKNVSLTSLLFPLYDFYKFKFNNNSILASVLTCSSTTFLLHTIDLLKIRQISDQKLYFSFNNMSAYCKYYYRGLHINFMRVIPHFTITMYLTESLKNKLSE